MPQSLTRLYLHVVFSTKLRETTIDDAWRPELHNYIAGIVSHRRGELLEAGGIEDHIHLLARIPATLAVADFVRDVKSNSSHWRHTRGDVGFAWQSGYGAFSVSPVQIETVRAYIRNQREHHRTTTFRDEYLAFLERYGIEFDERYVWD